MTKFGVMKQDYFEGADIAVTICAKDGTILDMNRKSGKTFLKPGREEFIFQTPWYDGDEYAGFMELSIVLPENIPNRVRKPKAE